MLTLADERFAPTTSEVSLVAAPIADVVAADVAMLRGRGYSLTTREVRGTFASAIESLEPLTVGWSPRTLWIEIGDWTAGFDSGWAGSDKRSAVKNIGRELGVRSLTIASQPDIRGTGVRRWGAVQFSLTEPGGAWRVVEAVNDTHWKWHLSGDVLPFEEVDKYDAPRRRDRFTSDMLERYCQALGIDVFNPDAYGPDACLIELTSRLGSPLVYKTMSLAEAQATRGIVPGGATTIRG